MQVLEPGEGLFYFYTTTTMPTYDYRELLRRPEWDEKRSHILRIRGYRCERCGRDAFKNNIVLHVHHIKYISGRMPWEYYDRELMCVCGSCHRIIHENIDETKPNPPVTVSEAIAESMARILKRIERRKMYV